MDWVILLPSQLDVQTLKNENLATNVAIGFDADADKSKSASEAKFGGQVWFLMSNERPSPFGWGTRNYQDLGRDYVVS